MLTGGAQPAQPPVTAQPANDGTDAASAAQERTAGSQLGGCPVAGDRRGPLLGAEQPQPPAGRAAVALVANAGSRRGQALFAEARDGFARSGVPLASAVAVADGEELASAVRDALTAGAHTVAIGGGDGTLRVAASVLAPAGATLAVIPLGTVNDFARNLGIAPDVRQACQVVADGWMTRVDVGRANNDYFLITASLGFSAIMQRSLTPGMKRWLGPLAYLVASLRAWNRLRHFHVEVETDGHTERLTVMQAGVINGHTWMGGRVEIPGIDLEDGQLAFYAIPPHRNFDYFRMARHVRRGQFFHTPGLHAFTTRDVTVRTRRHHHLVLDGDVCGEAPVRFGIEHAALRVCVPRDFAGAERRE